MFKMSSPVSVEVVGKPGGVFHVKNCSSNRVTVGGGVEAFFIVFRDDGSWELTVDNPELMGLSGNTRAVLVSEDGTFEEYVPPRRPDNFPMEGIEFQGTWLPIKYVSDARLWEHPDGYNAVWGHYLHYGPVCPDGWHEFDISAYPKLDEVRVVEVQDSTGRTILTDGHFSVG